jgi:hypothetical protein
MEAQLCKLCGERHSRYDPHVWPEITTFWGVSIITSDEVLPAVSVTEPIHVFETGYTPKAKAKFDRNAYQREYMRRRRAKR